MIIKIKNDFRCFKKDQVFDFKDLELFRYIIVVGGNGSGKSSLFHALRGIKNDSKSNSLYNRDYKDLSSNIEVEHNYEKIFHFDNTKDNGTDFMNAFDASELISSGGFQAGKKSHGEGSFIYLNKFLSKIIPLIVENKSLIILDEADAGFSLTNQLKMSTIIHNILLKYKVDIIAISHNPFLINSSEVVYDIQNNKLMVGSDYLKETTKYELHGN